MRANLGRGSTTEDELWMGTGSSEEWERGGGDSFLVEDQRNAATLLPIFAQHRLHDEWAAYNALATTTGNTHLTVNHSLHFVDPLTGAHTQSRRHVECM